MRRKHETDGIRTVDPFRAVQNGDGAPRKVMAGRECADDVFRAGDLLCVQNSARRRNIVAPEDQVGRAVRVRDPESLRVAEVSVHVLPAVVNDAAVGKEGGMPFKERTVSDLVHVGTVGFHREEIAHDVTVAHAEFRFARAGEKDPSVGKVDRIDVAHPASERDLAQARSVRIHLVDMVVVRLVLTHGEEDLLPVKTDVRVADDPFRTFQNHLDLRLTVGVQFTEIGDFQSGTAAEFMRVDLAVLEERRGIVVVLGVLRTGNEKDRRFGQFRVGLCVRIFFRRNDLADFRKFREHERTDLAEAGRHFGEDLALGADVIQRDVPPAADRIVDETDHKIPANEFFRVPRDGVEVLVIFPFCGCDDADGRSGLRAVVAQDLAEFDRDVFHRTAADGQSHFLAGIFPDG